MMNITSRVFLLVSTLKIGDKIMVQKFSIQNNLSYTDSVDADGNSIRFA